MSRALFAVCLDSMHCILSWRYSTATTKPSADQQLRPFSLQLAEIRSGLESKKLYPTVRISVCGPSTLLSKRLRTDYTFHPNLRETRSASAIPLVRKRDWLCTTSYTNCMLQVWEPIHTKIAWIAWCTWRLVGGVLKLKNCWVCLLDSWLELLSFC